MTTAAPTLNLVALEREEAPALFARLLRNVEIMLAQRVVHGDFSAYNVLYWEGEVKIIDFPQVVDPAQNRDAYLLFKRDVERLCQYFARYGVASQPTRLARELWARHAVPQHHDFA
jgi:RIO kinase 1